MLAISIKYPNWPYAFAGMVLLYLMLFVWILPTFLIWDMNLWAAILLSPFICSLRRGMFSLRYALPTFLALILAICIPVKTLFFIALIFSLMLLIENCLGKISEAFLFLLFLVSPVFKYLVSTVDFPIRLWLTHEVASLLTLIGIKATAAGNIIEMEGYQFAVDPACAGLNMLIISLILFLFLVSHFQKRMGLRFNGLMLSILVAVTVGLNICSNFFRMMLLVVFKIMPGTFLHDVIGIACLVVYVIVPLCLGIRFLLKIFGIESITSPDINLSYNIRYPLLHGIIIALLVFIGSNKIEADTLSVAKAEIELAGFNKQRLENGILKFENKKTLIYIKPALFYVPGHDPKICWSGSGYTFNHIKTEKIANTEVYTALLTKGSDSIYAAWWFDNGEIRSIDQLSWRWMSAKGAKPFYLVNVNTSNRGDLQIQVKNLLSNHHFLIKQ